VFDACWQIKSIPLEDVLHTQINHEQHGHKLTMDKDMVARDVPFVRTDLDGKHDSYGIITDIGLAYEPFEVVEQGGIVMRTFNSSDNWYGGTAD
jgi:hypothetical protein